MPKTYHTGIPIPRRAAHACRSSHGRLYRPYIQAVYTVRMSTDGIDVEPQPSIPSVHTDSIYRPHVCSRHRRRDTAVCTVCRHAPPRHARVQVEPRHAVDMRERVVPARGRPRARPAVLCMGAGDQQQDVASESRDSRLRVTAPIPSLGLNRGGHT
jgi:hypothetical protein